MIASKPFYICSVFVFPHAFAVAITYNSTTFLWIMSTLFCVELLRLTFAVLVVSRASIAFPACHSRSFALVPVAATGVYKGGDAIRVIEEGQAGRTGRKDSGGGGNLVFLKMRI